MKAKGDENPNNNSNNRMKLKKRANNNNNNDNNNNSDKKEQRTHRCDTIPSNRGHNSKMATKKKEKKGRRR